MRFGLIAAASLLLVACGSGEEGTSEEPRVSPASSYEPTLAPKLKTGSDPAERWNLQTNPEGVTLALLRANGSATIRLLCPSGGNGLLVNVPDFQPIGSEERLSFGGGGEAVALVADTRGDAHRGGVTGTGGVPTNIAMLIAGRVSASYGAQSSGPHPAPPQRLSRAFVSACGEVTAARNQASLKSGETTSACMMQGSERLQVTPLRAVGTEPFWVARIEGRCVTYSHPEDQDGTRVWTRHTQELDSGTWSGALGGQVFRLRTRAMPECSNGMSDKRYPLAVELMVHGELRRGCAEPL